MNNNIPNNDKSITERMEEAHKKAHDAAKKAWETTLARAEESEAKRLSKNLGRDVNDTLDLMRNDKDWKKVLDNEAYERTLKQIETGGQPTGVRGGVSRLLGQGFKSGDVDFIRDLFEPDANGKKPMFTNSGFRDLSDRDRMKAIQMMRNEWLKNKGVHIGRTSMTSGTTPSQAQLAKASLGARVGYLGKTVFDSIPILNLATQAGRDVALTNMGVLTTTSKIQMANSGVIGKLAIGGGTAFAGLATAYTAAQSENVGLELIATTGLSMGLQSGWRVGKAFSSSVGMTGHLGRITFGAGGAISGAAVGYGSFKTFEDLASQQSVLVGLAQKFSSREIMYKGPQDTRISATMRQAALQKLSSSSLNNRGQLLGNEAAILRGAPLG